VCAAAGATGTCALDLDQIESEIISVVAAAATRTSGEHDALCSYEIICM
jgi:hypothetical protein